MKKIGILLVVLFCGCATFKNNLQLRNNIIQICGNYSAYLEKARLNIYGYSGNLYEVAWQICQMEDKYKKEVDRWNSNEERWKRKINQEEQERDVKRKMDDYLSKFQVPTAQLIDVRDQSNGVATYKFEIINPLQERVCLRIMCLSQRNEYTQNGVKSFCIHQRSIGYEEMTNDQWHMFRCSLSSAISGTLVVNPDIVVIR